MEIQTKKSVRRPGRKWHQAYIMWQELTVVRQVPMVVILDQDGKIKSTMIIPTGGGAMMSAEKSLEQAVEKAGIRKEEIVRIVTTGYGRAYIDNGDDSITEITCHAKEPII